MATFDQLAADQRAIIEIVLAQGRSYEQIGEMLDLPPARVRELARDALAELAPYTAEFVDAQWRGQLADYVLGQQTGPEAQATRGHLKRSEPARIWSYSLLDALDDFYEQRDRPEIPVGEAGGRPSRRAAATNGEAPAAPSAPPAARRERAVTGGLSPAASAALMRRRILGGIAALAVIAAIVIGAIAIFGGGGNGSKKQAAPAAKAKAKAAPSNSNVQVVAQAVLAPIGAAMKGSIGAARVVKSGNQAALLVQAKLPPSSGQNKYVIWLYNSPTQYVGVAAGTTDKKGNFSGGQALPPTWQKYRFVDLTYQAVSGKKPQHGTSVMRGPLTAPTQQPSSGNTP